MTNQKSRVFILEPVSKWLDITATKEFGDLVYLFAKGENRPGIFHSNLFGLELLKRLVRNDFQPERDSICIVGSMVPMALYIAAAISFFGTINVLLFSAIYEEYVQKQIGQDWPTYDANNTAPIFRDLPPPNDKNDIHHIKMVSKFS